MTAAGLALMTHASMLMGLSWLGAMAGAFLALTSPIFVLHSTTVEVYSGLILGLSILIWLRVKLLQSDEIRWAILSCFVIGLFIGGHHPEFRLFGLIFLIPILRTGWFDLRRWTSCFLGGLAGTSIILFLPVRASLGPWRNWGNPSEFESLWDHFWALRIRTAYEADIGKLDFHALSQLAEQITAPFYVLTLFGLVGLFLKRRSALGPILVVILLTDILYSVLINPMGIRDLQNGMVSVYVLAWGAGAVFDSLATFLKSKTAQVIVVFAILMSTVFIFPSLTPRNDRGLTRLLTPIDRLSPVEEWHWSRAIILPPDWPICRS